MIESGTYLVTQEIAIRSGLIDSRYYTEDGRYVLNNRDLSRVRFRPDEFISGLKGVQMVTQNEAQTLIARNGFKMGWPIAEAESQPVVNEEPTLAQENDSESEEETNGNNEETEE